MVKRILVVDDNNIVTEVVQRYLLLERYDVMLAKDGSQALDTVREWHPDLVVLDLILPKIDGLEVCRQLRKESSIPIIMLTAKGEEADRIAGLELGADDYIVKPFSPRELVARVKTVLRRTGDATDRKIDGIMKFNNLVIEPVARKVTIGQRLINLTAKEFDLLYFLASHPNQVFTHKQVINEVWDFSDSIEYSTITVHIRRLRSKIEIDPMKPRFIKTSWGVGYKFEVEEHEIEH